MLGVVIGEDKDDIRSIRSLQSLAGDGKDKDCGAEKFLHRDGPFEARGAGVDC